MDNTVDCARYGHVNLKLIIIITHATVLLQTQSFSKMIKSPLNITWFLISLIIFSCHVHTLVAHPVNSLFRLQIWDMSVIIWEVTTDSSINTQHTQTICIMSVQRCTKSYRLLHKRSILTVQQNSEMRQALNGSADCIYLYGILKPLITGLQRSLIG